MLTRKLQKNEKKYHVPMVDRTPEEPPPVIVAVVGPSGVSLFSCFYMTLDPNNSRLAKLL